MAQQVKIAGALFQDVPSISVPDANDVWHAFTDTSDADAVAADIASGKTAYAGGVKLVGTNPGGATVEPLSVTENGVYTAPTGHAYSPVTVNVEGGGGGGGDMSDPIRFFDYDGTLVASYTAVPAELPDVPTHEWLVDGTWNYTLAEVGEQFGAVGACDIGANYATESGATEIDVEFVSAARLSPWIRFAVDGTVTVDWGDGTTSTVAGTSLTTRRNTRHTYAEPGKYTIKLFPTDGTTYAMYGNNTYYLLNSNNSNSIYNRIYANCVTSVRLGNGAIIGNYAFANCTSLMSVSIPSSVTSIDSNSFSHCISLKHVTIPFGVTSPGSYMFYQNDSTVSISIPTSVTSLGNYILGSNVTIEHIILPYSITNIGTNSFYGCYKMLSVTIPSHVTSILENSFYNCYSLTSIAIPDSITTIGPNAFNGCAGLAEAHLKPTTPPTLAATNAFSNTPPDCKFYVPYSKDHSILAAYQAATNWSTYASRMVEEPQ